MNRFAVKVASREVLGAVEQVMTRAGDWFWIVKEPEGWVWATSTDASSNGSIPAAVLTFSTKEKAARCAKKFRNRSHPWWCKPNGIYEIVEVKLVMKEVFSHYERADK
jgi:hypothetical protein